MHIDYRETEEIRSTCWRNLRDSRETEDSTLRARETLANARAKQSGISDPYYSSTTAVPFALTMRMLLLAPMVS